MILYICMIPFYEVQCYMYNPSLYFFTVDKETEALRDEWVIRDIQRINSKTRTRTWIWIWIPKFGAISFESFFFF